MSRDLRRFILVDTNCLRSDRLRELLDTTDSIFVLCEEVLLEMTKTSPFTTVKQSTRVVREFPNRFVVAKDLVELMRVSPLISGHQVKISSESHALLSFLSAVGRPNATYQELAAVKRASSAAMAEISRLLTTNPLRDWSHSLTSAELRSLRNGELGEHALFLMQAGCANTARNILREYGIDFPLIRPSDVTNLTAFALPLSKFVAGFLWTANGKSKKRQDKIINDVLDLQIALSAMAFDDILTNDRHCQSLHNFMRKTRNELALRIDRELLPYRTYGTMGYVDTSGMRFGFSSDKVLNILAQPFDLARPQATGA
jgi:hypothetical protein